MTAGGDKKGNAGGMHGALNSYLSSYDNVQYYNSVHDDGWAGIDDWKLQTRYRNKTYSTNFTPSAWVFKQYYNETYS